MLENHHLFIMHTKKKYKALATKLNEKTFLYITGSRLRQNTFESDIGQDPLGNTSYDESSLMDISKQGSFRKDFRQEAIFESDEDKKVSAAETKKFKWS